MTDEIHTAPAELEEAKRETDGAAVAIMWLCVICLLVPLAVHFWMA